MWKEIIVMTNNEYILDLKMMAPMGVDEAEAEMEELFAQDEAEEPPGTQSLTQEEGIQLYT